MLVQLKNNEFYFFGLKKQAITENTPHKDRDPFSVRDNNPPS